MDWLSQLLTADVLSVLIPIVAIFGFFALRGAKAYFRHAERMEKIRHGMDPDAHFEDDSN